MKTNIMKKGIALSMIALTVIISTAFISGTNESKDYSSVLLKETKTKIQDSPDYFFTSSWKNDTKEGAVISNITYVDCEYGSHVLTVEVAFKTFYDAHYGKPGVNTINAWGYATEDKAIRERRDLIAKYNNNKTETSFVSNFTVPCN